MFHPPTIGALSAESKLRGVTHIVCRQSAQSKHHKDQTIKEIGTCVSPYDKSECEPLLERLMLSILSR